MGAPLSYFYGQSELVVVKRGSSYVDILLSYVFRLKYEQELLLSTKRAIYFKTLRDISAV